MKKYRIIILSVVASTISFVSCRLEVPQSPEPEGTVFLNASIQDTKTSINGYSVVWDKGDQFAMYENNDTHPKIFTLISGEGSSNGVFQGQANFIKGFAKYPYNTQDKYSDGEIISELLWYQSYTPNGPDPKSMVMMGDVEKGENLIFHHMTSVLKISITGKFPVASIVVKAADSEKLMHGLTHFSVSDNHSITQVEKGNWAEDYNAIRLDCDYIQLKEQELTDFYISLLPGKYKGGLIIEINSPNGSTARRVSQDLSLEPSTLYSLEPFDSNILNGITPSLTLDGEGSEEFPFLIKSVSDLLCLQNALNTFIPIVSSVTGESRYAHVSHFNLEADLDLSTVCGPEIGSWIPLGTHFWSTEIGHFEGFEGVFDGQGHTIKGLYINSPNIEGGLFGDLDLGGVIKNLIVNGDVSASIAGIICRTAFGVVSNCVTYGKVEGTSTAGGICMSNSRDWACEGTITDCINYADVVGGGCGGISGSNDGIITRCKNLGNVKGTRRVGGIAGGCGGDVVDCVNYGAVSARALAGGISSTLVGSSTISKRMIFNCVNYGDVWSEKGFDEPCISAGIVPDIFGTPWGMDPLLMNCVNYGKVDSMNGASYGICFNQSGKVINCFWLYDGEYGNERGFNDNFPGSSFSFALTAAQFSGAELLDNSYKGYNDVVDVLNLFAFEENAFYLARGWEYEAKSGFPNLLETPATHPESENGFISASTNSVVFNTYANESTINISSSSRVSWDAPSWLTVSLDSSQEGNGFFSAKVRLSVDQNVSGSARKCVITFSNEQSKECSVEVTQRYSYVSEDFSRSGNVVTIQKAQKGKGINLVLMGDGYTDSDIAKGNYERDMMRGVQAFFSVEPYSSFRELFNVYYVEVVSPTNQFDALGTTAFGCRFGEGTLIEGDNTLALTYSLDAVGKSISDDIDELTTVVILNTHQYAGTCYMYRNTTTDYGLGASVSYVPLCLTSGQETSFEGVFQHEVCGHGFAKLDEEYSYVSMGTIPDYYAQSLKESQKYGYSRNIDFTSDPFSVKWSYFLQDERYANEGLGVFEGGASYWAGVYRPSYNSIMRHNTDGFSAPSREAIYYTIHKMAFGNEWEYDYEEFVEYDVVNRNKGTKSKATDLDLSNFKPLHRPIIVR